jgi:hypothetical protein
MKYILIDRGIWLNNRSADQKTINEGDKVKKANFPRNWPFFGSDSPLLMK